MIHFKVPRFGFVLLFAIASSAQAVVGDRFYVASNGNVQVKFIDSEAGYDDFLSLAMPRPVPWIMGNHSTSPGTIFDLGEFAAGTELIFSLYVRNTGLTYFTGPATANPDNVGHADVSWNTQNSSATVGFEDLWRGGDRDYNDLRFHITNVSFAPSSITTVPEPDKALLFLVGLLGIAAWRARRAH